MRRIGLVLVGFFLMITSWSQTSYTTPGSFTYTVPAGVTQIKVECWGAGGGGSSATSNNRAGGGGGGGAYASSIVTVAPGNTYTVVVGSGGAASSDGGSSSFNAGVVLADGGSGGVNNNSLAGSGGAAASSNGTIRYSGGNGGNGDSGSARRSGGGGGGAGSTGAGGNGATPAAGTGTSLNGGNGGAGVTRNNNGNSGSNYGGGGSGAYRRWSNRTGGAGADGLVIITLPADVTLSSPSQVVAGNVYQATTANPIYSFATEVSSSSATINTVSFTTSGTYVASDISLFQLWYSTTNDIATASQIGSDITTGLGSGTHSFTGLTQYIASGTTAYFWVTADIASAGTSGATIFANAITTTDLVFDLANVTGSTTPSGTQTIQTVANIALSSPSPAVAADDIYQGSLDNPIYSFTTAVTVDSAILNSLTFTTTGTYGAFDLTKYKLWYNTSNDLSSAIQVGSAIIGSLGTGSHTFSGFTLTTQAGTTGYFWITADVASFPTNNRNLTVSAITTGDLTYTLGIKTGSTSAGGQQTIRLVTGISILSTYPAVSATSILQESVKQRIYKFTTIITGANRTLNQVDFTTDGSYDAADIVNFRLWYNSVNSLITATQLGGTITTSLGTGTHSFTGLTQVTPGGATSYFWITADIAASATPGNTLSVNALTTADLTFQSGTKTSSTYAGGVQTILLNVDSDGDGSSDLYDLDDDDDGIPDLTENLPCNTSLLELFPNSDFEAGNTGFYTGYGYATGYNSLYPEGLYSVTPDASSVHDHFANCTGHGNMMVVNGSPNADLIVWSSGNIAVTPYTDYSLSVKITSVNPGNPAQLIFNVNGENIGSQFNATTTNCEWINAQSTWNSGSATTATFDIVNLNLVPSGNDFAIDDVSCTYRLNCDTDGDLIPDKLDLDSDNDGIYDVLEAEGTDADFDGIIDGYSDTDGDGLSDNVDDVNSGLGGSEVTSGTPLANPDTDGDGLPNIVDNDSDADLCFDTQEAGFSDADDDGLLGSSPVTVDTDGVVTSGTGYTDPDDLDSDGTDDYVQITPLITTQPTDVEICLLVTTSATFTIAATNVGGSYQWQVSTNGGVSFSDVSGATSPTMNLTGLTIGDNSNLYRALLSNPAYVCSPQISDTAALSVFDDLPSVPGGISGFATACPSVSTVYSIAAVPDATTYNWTVPAGWTITGGAGTESISVTTAASGSGTISVTATNPCGTSAASSLPVNITAPTPSITTPVAATVCQSVDITYTTGTGYSNYVWNITTGSPGADYTIISGGSSTDNTMVVRWLTTGSRTVTVTYSSGGCAGTPATKTVTVQSNAIITVQPVSPAAMCAGTGSASISVTAIGSVTGYQWQISTDGGSSFSNISNTAPYSNVTTATMTITNPPASLNNAQYRCLVTGSCGTVNSNPATLTVNSTSIDSQSTATQTQCLAGSFTPISVTVSGSGLSYQWYSNTVASTTGGTSLGSANGAQTDTYTPQATSAGTLYYYCTVSGSCGSATSAISGAFIVTPNNTITLSSAAGTDAQTLCINNAITNITYTTTGATGATFSGLPTGVSGAWAGDVVTISGTPTVAGTANYTITLTGGCGTVTETGSIDVTADNTITLSSAAGTDAQTLCINTAITNITYTTTGATGATFIGLPTGVSGAWAGDVVTISGTPTVAGTANYTITLTGGCGTVTETGSIDVTADNTITLSSAAGTDAQTLCINNAITNITYTTTGATGATFSGLPTGVSGAWAGDVVTISGTPTVAGTANYTITLTGGCGTVTETGSIVVTADNTITLSSAAGTDAQTLCINNAITNITYTTTGATGATFSGLPTGVSGAWAGDVVTISGTPTVAGTANYTITLTGGCGTVTETGSIDVTADNTITLSSAAGTDAQTLCINNAITNITYTTTGATGATFSGLPTGVSGAWAGDVVTISGTPTIAGTANYTITLTGGCGTVTETGSIDVTADNTITLSSAAGTDAQTLCINTAITNITYTTTGATGATFSGLPTGVSGAWAGDVVTISGTPTVAGTANYTITLTGGCGTVTETGSIDVTADNTITLSSAAGTDAQTLCINNAITNITYTTTGATGATFSGLPTGVSGAWAGDVVTISGTPTVAGTANYTITLTGGCGTVTETGSIDVTADNTITLSSAAGTDAQTLCINTAITNITYTTTGATGATFSGLPTGVSGAWAGDVVTISGTPTVAGTANYTITLTGGCGTVTETGSIDVTADNTITLSSAAGTDAQTLCINNAITNITYTTTGATGATFSGLPTGVSGAWAGDVVTISGTPTVAGTANYTITLTGGCGTVTETGSIDVTADNTITLSSAAGTDAQTLCINNAITNITYTTTGATGATFSGLPTGVSGAWAGDVVTISGTPTVAGTANYTITLTGGCGTVTETGSIDVTADNTITLSSAAGTDAQTLCINNAITNITYTTTGATGATFSGLPTGVSGAWAGDVVTISGTPTVAGTANYTITLTGGCGTVTETGSIDVTADNTITLSSAAGTDAQTLCINNAITNITYTTTGATGATFSGLPTGVSGAWAGDVVTISGTPTVAGTANYTITLTGGCGTVTETGSIVVNVVPSPSASGVTDAMERCTYTYTTGASGNDFVWTVTAGTIDSGQGTNEITVTWNTLLPVGTLSGPGTVEVEETIPGSGCQNTSTINITIHRMPETGPVEHIEETLYP